MSTRGPDGTRIKTPRKPLDPMTLEYLAKRHRASTTANEAMMRERWRQVRLAERAEHARRRQQAADAEAHMTES